jgi:adenylate cyclase
MRRALPFLAGGIALALVLGLRLADPKPVELFRHWVFDSYQRIEPRAYRPAGVRIVDIDEASLERLGQWPWPRTVLADLVTRLRDMGAAVIAFDVVFAEPDRTSPERVLAAWEGQGLGPEAREALAALPDPDAVFAEAIRAAPVVTGFAPNPLASPGTPPRQAGFAHRGPDPAPALPGFEGVTTNLPAIAEAAKGNGSFGISTELDAVIRRVPLFQRVGGEIYPALAMEALRVGQGASTHLIRTAGGGGSPVSVTHVKVGRIEAPTTARGELYLYDTGYQRDRWVPAWRVLDRASAGRVAELVRGHVVLIGTSAAGLKDLRATPASASVGGVSVHAQAIEQMILGEHLRRPDWATGLEVVVFLVAGVGLIALLPRVGAFWCSGIAAAAIAGGLGASWWAFAERQFLFDPIYPILAVMAIYMPTLATLFVQTESEKRFVRDAFGRYLSPALVERLAENPDRLRLDGEDRELTVMFSDIRGFTAFSESMEPGELTRFMNRYLTAMSEPILAESGYIDKYIGDAIMAFWNAPLDDEAHAVHACEAVLAMRAAGGRLNAARAAEAGEAGAAAPVVTGIGLHTGLCRVGNMGSDIRFNYSVLGDDVNLASRIEGQTKTYGVDVLLSEATRARAGEGYATLELDLIRVQGRAAPVVVHALIGRRAEIDADAFDAFAARHGAMLSAYRGRDFAAAREAAGALAAEAAARPGWLAPACDLAKAYALYAERSDRLAADPPGEGWDGVFETRKGG